MEKLFGAMIVIAAAAAIIYWAPWDGGCASAEALEGDPATHLGSEVCLEGIVSDKYDWPGRADWFKVVDGRGAVWVFGPSPPPEGTRVTVKGTFEAGDDCESPLVDYVICESEREIHGL